MKLDETIGDGGDAPAEDGERTPLNTPLNLPVKALPPVPVQSPPLLSPPSSTSPPMSPALPLQSPFQAQSPAIISDDSDLCIRAGCLTKDSGRSKENGVLISPEPDRVTSASAEPRQPSSNLATNKVAPLQGSTEEVRQFQNRFSAWTQDSKNSGGAHALPSYAAAVRDAHDDHGPHERQPSIVTAIAAGFINWSLMFGLCCAFGMIIFSDSWHEQHRALGVKMNLNTAMVFGVLLACTSGIPVAIGGPDLTPMIFLGSFVTEIADSIASQLQLDYPDTTRRRLWDDDTSLSDYFLSHAWGIRRLGGSSSDQEFCTGYHLKKHEDLCQSYHEQLIPTVIVAISISSMLLGVVFFTLGRLRMARLASFIPTSITEAFMSCIGYKVFKYALKFCKFEPRQFLPAACVGVPLYFVKAMHIGNPAVMIPLILGVPVICFYIYIYWLDGSNLDAARKDKLLFPVMENVEFWKVWEDSLFNLDKVNGKALLRTGPDLCMMILVTLMDCLLMLSYTESNLPVSVFKDYEIQLDGLGNIVTSLMGSPVGYMILKFNVLNYGVMGNVKDRRAGLIYAFLCGCCYFFTIELINYIPRFFLGILLFFAGAGFVAENLWGSRQHLSLHEWMQILVILVVFILTGELGWAILVGGLLTGLDFIYRYARVPCTSGNPLRGGELVSRERHGPVVQRNMQHIANAWLLVIKLKGYVFFASAQKLTQFIRQEMEAQADIPEYRRLKFITIDCQLLDGMDAAATKAMKRVEKEAQVVNMRILWSHVNDKVARDLKQRGLIETERDVFEDLDEVKIYVDQHILDYRARLQKKWLRLHPAFMLAKEMKHARMAFEPFTHVFLVDTVRRGCPWQYCGVLQVKAFDTVLWEPGQHNQDLFLIHSGAIGIYDKSPDEDREEEWDSMKPLAVYRHGWFLNRDMLIRAPARNYGVCYTDGEVLYWNERQWSRMAREVPLMASAISKMVMKQQVLDSDLMQMVVHPDDMPVFDEICEEEESMMANISFGQSLLPRTRGRTDVRSVHSDGSSVSERRSRISDIVHGIFQSRDSPRSANYGTNITGTSTDGRHSPGSCASNRTSRSSGKILTVQESTPSPVRWGTPHMDAPEMVKFESGGSVKSEKGPSEEVSPVSAHSPKKRISRPSLFAFFPQLFDTSIFGHDASHDAADSTSVAGRYVEKRTVAQLLIPEQLEHKLNGIQTAQVLDKYELYHSASQSSSMPRLPRAFQADLVIAFSTYCEFDENGVPYLDAQKLPASIMYAGIFNALVKPAAHASQRKMSLKEFLKVGHKAVMAKLSGEQENKIDQLFQEFDSDSSGDFDRDELIHLFRRMFHPGISIEEVEGVASAWLDEGHRDDRASDRIDRIQFRAIMSHIIREHEQDWTMLRGLRDLMGKHAIGNDDRIDACTMVEKSHSSISLEEAKEMLWVADWRLNGQGEGLTLEFVDIVAAVLLDIDLPAQANLPPKPKIAPRNRSPSLQQSGPVSYPDFTSLLHADRCVCGNIFKEDSIYCRKCGTKRPEERRNSIKGAGEDDFTNLIVDPREEDHDMRQLYEWAKSMAPSTGSDHELENTRTLHKRILEKHDNIVQEEDHFDRRCSVLDNILPGQEISLKLQAWCLVEEPHSSMGANLLSWFMGAMIMASVVVLVLEPLTDRDGEKKLWKVLELYFTIIFSTELFFRFLVSDAVQGQTRCGFLKGPSNICDFCAVMPYYVEGIFGSDDESEFRLLRIARLMRLSRVMKLAKLSNRSATFGPIAMVLTVIWGIYLKTMDD